MREQFDMVLVRQDFAEGFLGSATAEAVQPVGRHATHHLQTAEDVAVEYLGAVSASHSCLTGDQQQCYP